MERIALISDIHSNIVALKTVLNDIEDRGIDRIFCVGDLVLKGSSPCEVVDIVRNKCEVVLKGNGDDGAVNPQGIKNKQWYKSCLGDERIKYLDSLPMFKDVYISGSYVRMFHATKNDFDYRIFDTSSIEEKMKLFEDEENNIPDIVVYADIHKQYMQKIKNKTIINIGSVGSELECSILDDVEVNMEEMTQAHYCIIEGEMDCLERKPISVQFVRVPYNIDEEIELAKKNASPSVEKYIDELKKAKYRGKAKKYIGRVIKQGFVNDNCLEGINVENENVSDNGNIVYTIKVYEGTVKYLSENLKSNKYCMYFENESDVIVIYKDKTFKININDKEKLKEAFNYGINLGISSNELEMVIGRIK